MPNSVEFGIHTYFLQQVGVDVPCVLEHAVLEQGVGLDFPIVTEVEVRRILCINLHVFDLWLWWLLFVILVEVHFNGRWWSIGRVFDGVVRARATP